MTWAKDWIIIWWSRLGHPSRCRSDCDWCFKKWLNTEKCPYCHE